MEEEVFLVQFLHERKHWQNRKLSKENITRF